jgi:hypothetical protein
MPGRNKLRITQSLLSAWEWSYKTENGYADFLDTLKRVKKPPTQAMLDGVRFEGIINAALDGEPLDEAHEWYKPISEIVSELRRSQKQVVLYRDITVNGVPFLLHGVLDFLKAGIIYDTKFSKSYSVGKYRDSPQHPMYFALVPEAYKFQYTISDGKYVYRETYYPDDTEPIEIIISNFMIFLERQNLIDTYAKYWQINNKGEYNNEQLV